MSLKITNFNPFKNLPPVNGIFGDDDEFITPDILHLPIEIDCEFEQTKPSPNNNALFQSKTLTVQLRHIDLPVGEIYHPPEYKDTFFYDRSGGLCSLTTYLGKLGTKLQIHSTSNRVKTSNVIHLHLYSFFAIAELLRVFHGSLKDEIMAWMLSDKYQHITQGKRVIAESIGGVYKDYIDLEKHYFTLNGIEYRFRLSIYDTSALQGATSYAILAKNTGVKLDYKDAYTPEQKSRMNDMMEDSPETFKNYALGDLHNYDILKGHSDIIYKVYESLRITDKFQAPRMTIGATISRMLESCLQSKLGIADIKHLNSLLEYATAKTFLNNPKDTSIFLGKVDGGRCRNNRPKDVSSKNAIADIDIKSAYGSGLRYQDYPIGRPVVIEYPTKSAINAYMSLREFLKKYRGELVPGLWFARVSTVHGTLLTHKQDFFPSWKPPKDLNKLRVLESVSSSPDEWYTHDNEGVIKIFTNEIRLSVLNHDGLQWIENCCSKPQQKELLDKLVVDCALFYPVSLECNSVESLLSSLAEHKGKNTTSYKDGTKKRVEKECYSWYRVSMGELIVDTLLKERSKYEKDDPMNAMYKLCTNTVYGVMVSPHFHIGNVCVGNNITARVRTLAWCMEKGLNTFQTITDGGAFELNRVSVPSIQYHTAESFVPMSDKGMNYKYSSLGDRSWSVLECGANDDRVMYGSAVLDRGETLSSIDKLASQHLRLLFAGLDVLHKVTQNLQGVEQVGIFQFETKGVYYGISTHGSANYALFNHLDEPVKVKMRSYRKNAHSSWDNDFGELFQSDDEYYPAKEFLVKLYRDATKVLRGKTFIHRNIMKIGEWKRGYGKNYQNARIFPGCEKVVARLLRECSLSTFTFESLNQWESWERESSTLRDTYEQSYEGFFTIGDGQRLDYTALINALEEAIRTGKQKYTSVRSKGDRQALEGKLKHHPERSALADSKRELQEYQGMTHFDDRDPFGECE